MKKIILGSILISFIIGCGGSSGSGDRLDPTPTPPQPEPAPPVESVTHMIVGQSYQTVVGDEVNKTSLNAKVQIFYYADSNVTGVLLLDGSADLTHY